MTALEQRLLELGRELAVPAGAGPRPRARAARRAGRSRGGGVALAVAVVAVAIAAAFAVPQARTSILRFFHLGGATVERVEHAPAAQ